MRKIKALFVQVNSIKAVKAYFKERLIERFTESEINFMFKEAVMKRMSFSSSEYLLSNDKLVSESDLLFFRSVVKRLLTNEPFQYIIGKTEFFGLELKIDKRALIPRPETEELVEWITESFPKDEKLQIIDMCTGSGCIALALKSVFTKASVFATDISSDSIGLAKENSTALKLPIELYQIDATNPKKTEGWEEESFDCWVSNPPYIPNSDKLKMEKNVLDFEPHIALFVENDDPLLFYREIGKSALKYLKQNGLLFFELHEDLAVESAQLMKDLGFVNIQLRKDLQGKNRMLKAQKP